MRQVAIVELHLWHPTINFMYAATTWRYDAYKWINIEARGLFLGLEVDILPSVVEEANSNVLTPIWRQRNARNIIKYSIVWYHSMYV